MLNIYAPPPQHFRPTSGVHAFVDRLNCWLLEPLTVAEWHSLKQRCGELKWPLPRVVARFNPTYRQHLHVYQPKPEALEFLAARRAHMNYVELALDWTYDPVPDHHDPAWRAYVQFVRRAFKQYHRGQKLRDWPSARGSGKRWENPNVLMGYCDAWSKASGEVHCVHVEWQISGVVALRRLDLHSPADLIDFDHRAFWSKRLLIIDIEALGRAVNNHVRGTPGRKEPWIETSRSCVINMDHACGSRLIQGSGSMQELLDDKRLPQRIQRNIRKYCVDVADLLPEPRSYVNADKCPRSDESTTNAQ